MSSLRISEIRFAAGPSKNNPALSVQPKNVTILVGPNNSGKSQTLREINSRTDPPELKVLSEIHMYVPSEDSDINELFLQFKSMAAPETNLKDERLRILYPHLDSQAEYPIDLKESRDVIKNHKFPNNFKDINNATVRNVFTSLMRLYTIMLNGRGRFNLVQDLPKPDLKQNPTHFLSSLYLNGDMERLSKIIFDEFGFHLYIDATSQNLSVRVNREDRREVRRSLENEALEFFRESLPITEVGDGVQAFTGLLLALMSLPHKIMLIDEPEAFLHPPAIQSLARNLSSLAVERNASLIVSTHSADFLMGCIDTTPDITVVRLTYDGKHATATQLSGDQVKYLRTKPLLRSTDVLSALFHQSAVITEGDTDRIFYNEINRRIWIQDRSKAIRDAIFLNAVGKHVVHQIASPLRKIGIPVACIYDLDILRVKPDEDRKLWKKILQALNLPVNRIEHLDQERARLEKQINEIQTRDDGADIFEKQGLYNLPQNIRNAAFKLLDEVKVFGLFIVPVGAVERWLQNLGIKVQKKEKWIIEVLDGLDKHDIKPSEDDVWQFMNDINEWIKNPNRLG